MNIAYVGSSRMPDANMTDVISLALHLENQDFFSLRRLKTPLHASIQLSQYFFSFINYYYQWSCDVHCASTFY